ncbi:hypothetical protein RHPLAN_31460 [Rhodoplanes sp. Z2-YC6860]|nr:hypothetical protein RHPLAN_31460 [Rhodoplanes sp. Z2-YC6860]
MGEHLKNSALPRALSEVIGDVAELLQKEIKLARTEVSEKISEKLRAGVWLSVTATAGLIAVLLLVEALVFGIAAYGLALHWSCLIVAAVMAAIAAAAFFIGKTDADQSVSPTRSIHQVKQDFSTVKEQLT